MKNIIATWVCVDTADNGTWFPSAKGNSADIPIQNIYWRCVACFFSMARFFNPDTCLILFSNIDRQQLDRTPIGPLLGIWGVEFHPTPFEYVTPSGYFNQWRNQFYEFSIFKYLSTHPNFLDTDRFLLLDSDCIIRADLAPLFSAVDRHNCISYIIDYEPDQVINGNSRLDMQAIFGQLSGEMPDMPPAYHAGEFLACTGQALRLLIRDFYPAWDQLMQMHYLSQPVLHEEAHVLSYLFYRRGFPGGQANKFIKRLWTDPSTFRNVEKIDAELPVWHLPAEKRTGFRNFFDWLQGKDFDLCTVAVDDLLRRLRHTFNVPDIPFVKKPYYLTKKVAKKIIG